MWYSLILRELVLGIPNVIQSVPVKVPNSALIPTQRHSVPTTRGEKERRKILVEWMFCVLCDFVLYRLELCRCGQIYWEWEGLLDWELCV